MCRPAATIPIPQLNPKFAHKLAFLDEMRDCTEPAAGSATQRAILVGDLNVAPLEHDVWSHKQMLKVVSHTPIECEKLTAVQQRRRLDRRHARASCRSRRSSTLGGAIARRRLGSRRPAAAGSIISGSSPALADRVSAIKIAQGCARLGAAVRPCAGDRDD